MDEGMSNVNSGQRRSAKTEEHEQREVNFCRKCWLLLLTVSSLLLHESLGNFIRKGTFTHSGRWAPPEERATEADAVDETCPATVARSIFIGTGSV
jgi:hypothetical protein